MTKGSVEGKPRLPGGTSCFPEQRRQLLLVETPEMGNIPHGTAHPAGLCPLQPPSPGRAAWTGSVGYSLLQGQQRRVGRAPRTALSRSRNGEAAPVLLVLPQSLSLQLHAPPAPQTWPVEGLLRIFTAHVLSSRTQEQPEKGRGIAVCS